MIVINRLCFIIETYLLIKQGFSKKDKVSKIAKTLNITKCREMNCRLEVVIGDYLVSKLFVLSFFNSQ
jgi:hypothetical protein